MSVVNEMPTLFNFERDIYEFHIIAEALIKKKL